MTPAWFLRALERKRAGDALDAETWSRVVGGYVDGTLDDAPVAALLMAITIRGLDEAETFALTDAMVGSGETLRHDLPVVDKHSSGGVADTVSLIAVPLVAACGVRVAKLSGRALGHTGGTLDKLEAIPGLRTDLSPEAFRAQVAAIGCAIAAQSDRFVPADRKLYALRDRTATVASLGLIAASIVSKKIAGGAGAIVFDVKTGAGAFLRTRTEAEELGSRMTALVRRFGRTASALVTSMDEPLGPAIGTGLEAIEARETLAGRRRDPHLWRVVELVATEMLVLGGLPPEQAPGRLAAAYASGAGYQRLVALVEAQGGTRAGLEGLLPAPGSMPVPAAHAGRLAAIDPVALGEAARALVTAGGSGAGIIVRRRIGDRVDCGETLAEIVGGEDVGGRVAAAFTLAKCGPDAAH